MVDNIILKVPINLYVQPLYKVKNDYILTYGNVINFFSDVNLGMVSFSRGLLYEYYNKNIDIFFSEWLYSRVSFSGIEIDYLRDISDKFCSISSLEVDDDMGLKISFGIDDILLNKYGDDWYTVHLVIYKNDTYNYNQLRSSISHYRCDTFEGVKQLLNGLIG